MSDRVKGAVIGGLLLFVALSLLGNFFLYHGYTAQRDRAVKAESDLTQANAATTTCNKSIQDLEHAAYKRGVVAAKRRAAGEKDRAAAEESAQQILSTPATVPGDDCRSAQDRVTKFLTTRRKP